MTRKALSQQMTAMNKAGSAGTGQLIYFLGFIVQCLRLYATFKSLFNVFLRSSREWVKAKTDC